VQHPRNDRFDGGRRAEDGAAERLLGKRRLGEEVVDAVVRGIERGADLLDDDVLLALQLAGIESRVGENVGENVDGEGNVVLSTRA
jgi:hypothetical protein